MGRDPFNARGQQVFEVRGWRRLAAWLASLALRLYYATLRLRLSDQAQTVLAATPAPRILLVWHNRSLVAPAVFARFLEPPRISCLISPSRAAAWQASFFKDMRLRVVRGSSTRRSIPALRQLLRELRRGQDVGISPDGPKGPLYAMQPGALFLARMGKVPLVALNFNCRWAWRPNCWDRHLVPLPFAKVVIEAVRVDVSSEFADDALPALQDSVRNVCLAIVDDRSGQPFQASATITSTP